MDAPAKTDNAELDRVYTERNHCVAALARMALAMGLRVGLASTPIEGWAEEWYGCVYIDLPTGQVSWHFHAREAPLFTGLPAYAGAWDGHDTPEKYRRVDAAYTLIDTADIVRNRSTGEEWVVAHVDGTHLAWCGWPEGMARLSDCQLVIKATPERRDELLHHLAAIREPDSRQRRAAGRLLDQAAKIARSAEPHIDEDLQGMWVPYPSGLNTTTAELVALLAFRLAGKLRKAERKHGYTDEWRSHDWEHECRSELARHVQKGDPLDVAAYCAFCLYHGWSAATPFDYANSGPRLDLDVMLGDLIQAVHTACSRAAKLDEPMPAIDDVGIEQVKTIQRWALQAVAQADIPVSHLTTAQLLQRADLDTDPISSYVVGDDWGSASHVIYVVKGGQRGYMLLQWLQRKGFITPGKAVAP